MTERTCSLPGCESKHRARGLCSTHYNQGQPARHAIVATICTMCSAPIARGVANDRRHICSVACRNALSGYTGTHTYRWSQDAAQRAREAGARIIDLFNDTDVHERDAWTCYLCNERCDTTVDRLNAKTPTVDHVIPLSKGGDHTLTNCRTACLRCNSRKQDATL